MVGMHTPRTSFFIFAFLIAMVPFFHPRVADNLGFIDAVSRDRRAPKYLRTLKNASL